MNCLKQGHYDFLNDIKENNNREWFLENKDRYLGIKKEIEYFASEWFSRLNDFDESLQNYGEKPYLFRIYRDARFAKGRPYKTNYGVLIGQGGRKMMHKKSGYYLNIEPGNNFLVGGIWRPEPKVLDAFRESIDKNSKNLRKIINKNELKSNFEISGEQLKTSPRGYYKKHKDVDLLRYKDFYAIKYFTDEEVLNSDFVSKLEKYSKIVYPLNQYINSLEVNN